jgi:hypothetical protein
VSGFPAQADQEYEGVIFQVSAGSVTTKSYIDLERLEILKKECPRFLNGLKQILEWKGPDRERSCHVINQKSWFSISSGFRLQTF